ncbi:hypothetical protein ACFEMC_04900 [Kineococcus sp. DHX-1]|uniref:hypothetical protein n=1 Tax=Kineococcus sp. DHX-1 TaxID=3349638 RepID=UPI0036D414E9
MARREVRAVGSALKAQYWRTRFGTWGRRGGSRVPGYSLVVPVPGDLPVFLDLALQTCASQRAEHRVETLVVPDVATPETDRVVQSWQGRWNGPLRTVALPWPERRILPWLKDPGRNHGVQLISAASVAAADHVVLHDADLFMLDEDLHDDGYRRARDGRLDVVGIEPSWDAWYAAHGRTLAATWEQTSRVDWLRSVPPHRHLGHDANLWGERHTFDTTFWAQCRTSPDRIAVTGESERIVHFNYVISTYRKLQRSSGPFHDHNFRLLLIRLFIDLFASDDTTYEVPELPDLVRGLGEPLARVHYRPEDAAEYQGFMAKFRVVMDGPLVDPARRERADEALRAFDEFFSSTTVREQ